MSRRCLITGKSPLFGHNISHAHNVTNKVQRPNIQRKRIFVPELGRFIRIKLAASSLRTIEKIGLLPFLKKNKKTIADIT